MTRWVRVLVVVAAIGLLAGCAVAPASGPAGGDLYTQVNTQRAQAGLGGLSVDGELVGYAQSWAGYLSSTGRFEHSSLSFSWPAGAEVLALGGDPVGQWMGSPPHRSAILAGWAVAIGCATAGQVTVCEVGG